MGVSPGGGLQTGIARERETSPMALHQADPRAFSPAIGERDAFPAIWRPTRFLKSGANRADEFGGAFQAGTDARSLGEPTQVPLRDGAHVEPHLTLEGIEHPPVVA